MFTTIYSKVLNSDKITPFMHVLYKPCFPVSYTNGCLCSNVTPEDEHDGRPKHVEFLEIKAKTQLHLVDCIYTY
jgi:hypothetical protein